MYHMKEARLRYPTDPDYIQALGTAAYCFAMCEWNAVYCAERIRPGSLKRFLAEKCTAGTIAKKLVDLTSEMPKSADHASLSAAARRFKDLVPIRNRILHGNPCTGPNGKARLSGPMVLEISDLESAADDFSACSIELNRLFHGFLSTYAP